MLAAPARIPGYTRAVRRLRSGYLAVVMYHGVDLEPMEIPHWCHLDLTRFEEQIQFLSEEYTIIELREAIDRLESRAPLPARCAVVTFDDALRDVYTTAYPVLRRRGVPATVFVVTGLIESRQPIWTDRIYLAVSNTSRSSITLGRETWPLTTNQEREWASSALRQRLKKTPNGERVRRLEVLLDELGYPPNVPPDSPLATMGWEEIEELSRSGLISFGSHTHSHPILSRCELELQQEELQVSRDLLRDRLGNADLFAYPNGTPGDYTQDTKRLLLELGYRCGLVTTPGLNPIGADRYELRRVEIGNDITLAQFEMLMAGL
jgi:peptidoglycan/xylan/chitin deacetylase (PgdA/CDA1 family)